MEKKLQRDGVEQGDCGGDLRRFDGQQVGRAFISARTVFTGGVVPELVGGGFGEEIGFGREDLSLEQFGFDGVVNAFDVGVGVGAGRGIEAVLGVVFLFDGPVKAADLIVGGVAVVFGAEVGGDDDLGGVEAMVFEMGEEAIHGQGGVSFGEFVAVGQELGAAREFADGVLEAGQAIGLHLRPVEREVGEVFDIHLEAGERRIGRFDGAEIIFTMVAALGGAGQLVVAEDAVQGIVADLESELGDETAGAEAGCFFALGHAFGFQRGRGFMRAAMRGAADGQEALVAVDGKAPDPLAHGVFGALVAAGGGLDALFDGIGDQLMAESEFRIAGADHGVIRWCGGQRSKGG